MNIVVLIGRILFAGSFIAAAPRPFSAEGIQHATSAPLAIGWGEDFLRRVYQAATVNPIRWSIPDLWPHRFSVIRSCRL